MKRMDEKDGWDWIEMKPEVNLLIPETGRRMIAQCYPYKNKHKDNLVRILTFKN